MRHNHVRASAEPNSGVFRDLVGAYSDNRLTIDYILACAAADVLGEPNSPSAQDLLEISKGNYSYPTSVYDGMSLEIIRGGLAKALLSKSNRRAILEQIGSGWEQYKRLGHAATMVAESTNRGRLDPMFRETGLVLAKDAYTETFDLRYLLNGPQLMRRADDGQSITSAALMVDVDRMKDMNTALGHGGTDMVLRAIVEIMTGQIRARNDLLGRTGGDEFSIGLDRISPEDSEEWARRLQLAIYEIDWDASLSAQVRLSQANQPNRQARAGYVEEMAKNVADLINRGQCQRPSVTIACLPFSGSMTHQMANSLNSEALNASKDQDQRNTVVRVDGYY